jgi:SAM-dependent methyltransferase
VNTNVDFEQLRSSFAGKAHAYHLSRPPYKSQLISSIFEHCALKEGARVLEIGCGTGQATQGFLDRGAIVTAVEKASDMASYARGCLRASPTQLTIHTQAFEEFELEAGSYDLVIAAAAIHWVLPEYRYAKPFAALKPGGHLAILWGGTLSWNEHVRNVFESFWKEIHGSDYELGGPFKSFDEDVRERKEPLDSSGFFEPAQLLTAPFEKIENVDTFITFLTTWSSLEFMNVSRRGEFLEETRKKLNAVKEPLASKESDLALVARKPS